ncbi:hypothetical protein NQT74_01940 [Alteromonas stellipolaris]|uniref:hypothetical protein n=1 Tax=Alteromonas stellipolaris TaxID=233316 RepID=UPI00211814D1|nr:hypothetical protein [Alteromonas stellipolaris]MCQ8847337.1 hypothetical protein [Alteromonas stellipolaris]
MQYVAKALVTLFCLGMLIVAYRWGVANVNYVKASNKLKQAESVELANSNILDSVKSSVDGMLALHPSHPHYLNTAGTYYERLAFASENPVEKNKNLKEALKVYQESAVVREVWPRTWANIFRVKAKLGEFDSEFSHAVTMANLYGGKDEFVAKELVFIMLRHWRQFNSQNIAVAIEQLNNLTDYNRFKNVYEYSLLIGERAFFCNLVKLNSIETKFQGCSR